MFRFRFRYDASRDTFEKQETTFMAIENKYQWIQISEIPIIHLF